MTSATVWGADTTGDQYLTGAEAGRLADQIAHMPRSERLRVERLLSDLRTEWAAFQRWIDGDHAVVGQRDGQHLQFAPVTRSPAEEATDEPDGGPQVIDLSHLPHDAKVVQLLPRRIRNRVNAQVGLLGEAEADQIAEAVATMWATASTLSLWGTGSTTLVGLCADGSPLFVPVLAEDTQP